MSKPFASTGDTEAKVESLEVLADGVYALTAEGDPNVGAIEGEDFVVCFDARSTPVFADRWLHRLREHTDKPIRHLVLSHFHAVRTLGASAFGAQNIVAHTETTRLIGERGQQDWASELGRLPRSFEGNESIPGLTRPTVSFSVRLTIELGGDRGPLELMWLGRGHTSGDVVAWVAKDRILFAGDLVENGSAVYTGDAYHREWIATLDRVAQLGADQLVGGRGGVAGTRAEAAEAIAATRDFLRTLIDAVDEIVKSGGTVREAYRSATAALAPGYGHLPVFQHVLVFDSQRAWDELHGVDPQIWTADLDRTIWAELTA